jgi:hypothetical protein
MHLSENPKTTGIYPRELAKLRPLSLRAALDNWQEGPDDTNPLLVRARLLISIKTKRLPIPSPTSLFFSPLFFKSMKGSVTGEVGTIVSFWLKRDSLSRGWHHQRDLKYGSDIRNQSLQMSRSEGFTPLILPRVSPYERCVS